MSNARIMVVEDEWAVADDLKLILQSLGYTVTSVSSTGEDAIQKAEEDKPDLVLMDIVLEGEMDGIEAAIPCGLIVNELVSNSLKYAFPEGKDGEIIVSFRTLGEDQYELIVSDNGVGLPEDLDLKKAETLGLRLATNFTERTLHGKIEMKRHKGTEFQIIFKEKKYKERM